MEAAAAAFARTLAEPQIQKAWKTEYLPAPHRPSGLPSGKMAIYAFWAHGEWLKIGRVGPKSDARYRSQHYNPRSAGSTLAKSLLLDPAFKISEEGCGDWIKQTTCRCNIIIPADQPMAVLSALEAHLHYVLKPRFEGRAS